MDGGLCFPAVGDYLLPVVAAEVFWGGSSGRGGGVERRRREGGEILADFGATDWRAVSHKRVGFGSACWVRVTVCERSRHRSVDSTLLGPNRHRPLCHRDCSLSRDVF